MLLASGFVVAAENSNIDSATAYPHYDSWNEKKQSLQQQHGLQLGMDYNMLGLTATDALGNSSAASGALRVFGQWDLVETESGSKGGLVFKFEHRHKYTDSSPKEFGAVDLGYIGFAHSLYGDQALEQHICFGVNPYCKNKW